MNTAIIESITWHRDQLFKLLNSDQDLEKYEGSIYNLEKDFDEILEKAKQKVYVKPTANRKGYYREQEVGRKEDEGKARARAEMEQHKKKISEKNEYGISMQDINEGDYIDAGQYGKGYVTHHASDDYVWITPNKKDRYNQNAPGKSVHISDIEEILE